jgi:hypothetical protein
LIRGHLRCTLSVTARRSKSDIVWQSTTTWKGSHPTCVSSSAGFEMTACAPAAANADKRSLSRRNSLPTNRILVLGEVIGHPCMNHFSPIQLCSVRSSYASVRRVGCTLLLPSFLLNHVSCSGTRTKRTISYIGRAICAPVADLSFGSDGSEALFPKCGVDPRAL